MCFVVSVADKKERMFRMMPLLSRERYVLGFTECAAATANFLESDDNADHNLKTNVQRHLESCLATTTSLGSHVTMMSTCETNKPDDTVVTSSQQNQLDSGASVSDNPDVASAISPCQDTKTTMTAPEVDTKHDVTASLTTKARTHKTVHSAYCKTQKSEEPVDNQLESSVNDSEHVCDIPKLAGDSPWRPW